MKIEILILFTFLINAYQCANVSLTTSPPVYNGSALSPQQIPQFVLMSFDDAVTVNNYPTYKELSNYRNKKNACPIQATFFIIHENTNYQLVNDLWRRGHEISIKTLTHASNTDYWKRANKTIWHAEITGMRKVASIYADIPELEIKGFRASYLQTGGNVTLQVLHDTGFQYDSSMPTLQYSKPKPIFPYTYDNGFPQDCQIQPCPAKETAIAGLWEVPIIDYWKKRLVIDEPPTYSDSPCSMADFCLPTPETSEETFQYFKDNFERHHSANRAPFPIFIHETFLSEPERRKGYFEFLEYLNSMEEVYMVSIQEMLTWMENPVPLEEYRQTKCVRTPLPSSCEAPGTTCLYTKVQVLNKLDKQLVICSKDCPAQYPWIYNPEGHNPQS